MVDSPVKPGDVLAGKYRVERMLGMGCMGVVVAAEHITLQQRCAIKFLLPGKGTTEEQHTRFLREAQASVRLKTEHVARVYDAATLESGAPYIVMELLDGQDLAATLAERGPLPIPEAVDYVLQACEAVAEAHACGIVHRDIKPANLFLSRASGGRKSVKVLDFGISKWTSEELKMTQDQAVLGSPLYMSPEQMRQSAKVDARSDIWSLGVVLYELVAGKTPFHGERMMELYTKVTFDPPTPLGTFRSDAPPTFEAVLLQAFEKDRDRRWPNVAEFAAALVPFGTAPLAALHAQQVAELLGAQIAPARPTDVGLPEPAAPSAAPPEASGTANALTRSSMTSPAKRSRAPLAVAAALAAIGLVAGGAWALRGSAPGGSGAPTPSGIAPQDGATTATATTAGTATTTTGSVSATPLATAHPSAEAPLPDAGPSAPGTASPTSTASDTAASPNRGPIGKGTRSPTTPAERPKTKAKGGVLYDQ